MCKIDPNYDHTEVWEVFFSVIQTVEKYEGIAQQLKYGLDSLPNSSAQKNDNKKNKLQRLFFRRAYF